MAIAPTLELPRVQIVTIVWTVDTYSGALGKGQVLKVDTLCTPDGRPVAVKPGGNVN